MVCFKITEPLFRILCVSLGISIDHLQRSLQKVSFVFVEFILFELFIIHGGALVIMQVVKYINILMPVLNPVLYSWLFILNTDGFDD